MSFLVKQPALPQSQGGDEQQVSSNREADPIGMGYGRDLWGSHWLCDAYGRHSQPAGANRPEWQYASIAAGYRIGPIKRVGRVFLNGKEIVDLGYTFEAEEDSHVFTINPALASGRAWTLTLYRGTESQQAHAALIAGTGQNHPAYRGLVVGIWDNIDCGQGQTAIPQLALELFAETPDMGDYPAGGSELYGVNPFAAIYGFATEQKGGLGIDGALFDAEHWGAQALALDATGIGQRVGDLVKCHPSLSQAQDAAAFFSNVLSYVDGYMFAEGDGIKVGWFPHTPVDAGELAEISEHDLDAKPGGKGFGDWNAGPSDVTVVFRDAARRYTESPASVPAAANLETGIIATAVRKDRPFIHYDWHAAFVAAELAADVGTGDDGVNLSVLKSRAVDPDGAPLMPAMMFNWDYGPHSLDLVCRVVSRRMRTGGASDVLTVIRERGAFPRPYVAAVDERVLPMPDEPGEIDEADVRLWLLARGLASTRRVAAIINRSKRTIYRADLHLSVDGSAPWSLIQDSRCFAAKCEIVTSGISDSATTVRVESTSVDFARMAEQNEVAQEDDTLLALIDDELVSIGSITSVATDTCDLGILRGRRGTTAAAHTVADIVWLFYRSELQANAAEHAEFYNVRDGSNAYDVGIATKYFKIALATIDADGEAKPDDPGIALQLPDLSASEVLGYTIILTNEAHTVATDAAGNVNAGQLGAGGTARTDVAVYRGSTALTAVASAPNSDQFAIALGTLTNTTATKEDANTVRCDTLTADTGTIAITVSVAGGFTVTKIFTLTKVVKGAAGAAGADGSDGTDGIDGLDGSKVFFLPESTPPSGPSVGDTWWVTDLGYEYRRWSGSAWVAPAANTAFEIVGGITYIKKLAVRQVDAAAIVAGTINVALTLAAATIDVGSGIDRFYMDGGGARYGNASGSNVSMDALNSTTAGFFLRHTATPKTTLVYDSVADQCILTMGTFDRIQVGSLVLENSTMQFGNSTNLYSGGSHTLQTDDNFVAASVNTTSARRYKENIGPIEDALGIVGRLQGVVFDWRNKNLKGDIGFIAEEVGEVLPTLVVRDDYGRAEAVDYGRVTAVLVEAVKQLERRVHGLES